MENRPTFEDPQPSLQNAPNSELRQIRAESSETSHEPPRLVSRLRRGLLMVGWTAFLVLAGWVNRHEVPVVVLCALTFLLLLIGCAGHFSRADLKHNAKHREAFFHNVQSTLLLTVFFMTFVHGSPWGSQSADVWDTFLRHQMPDLPADRGYPVVVIDTGGIGTWLPPLATHKETDVRPIAEFVRQVRSQSTEFWPKSMGIDLDFQSPEGVGGPLRSTDEMVLSQVNAASSDATSDSLKQRLPIAVGGYESYKFDSHHRLSVPNMENMLAAMDIPPYGTSHLYAQIAVEAETELDQPVNQKSEIVTLPHELSQAKTGEVKATMSPVISLGQWLYEASYLKRVPTPEDFPKLKSVFDLVPLYRSAEVPVSATPSAEARAQVSSRTLLVDYRHIYQLRSNVFPLEDYVNNATNLRHLKGKVVLLGDVSAQEDGDKFRIPGFDSDQPGVFLNAALAATLLTKPLREVAPWFGLTCDLLLAVLALGVLHVVHSFHPPGKRVRDQLKAISPSVYFCVLALSPVFLSLLATKFNILWPEAILISMALLVHALYEWIYLHFEKGSKLLEQAIMIEEKLEIKAALSGEENAASGA